MKLKITRLSRLDDPEKERIRLAEYLFLVDESALLFRLLRNRVFGQRVTSAEIAEQIGSVIGLLKKTRDTEYSEPLSYTARSDCNFRIANITGQSLPVLMASRMMDVL